MFTISWQYNLHSPCSDLFGKGRRAFLGKVRDQLSETHQLLLDNYLSMIDALAERLKPIDQLIRARAKTDPRIALLTTMPGVGVYTATVIVTKIGDVTRFTGPKQLCSFAGLVPSTRSSDAYYVPLNEHG